MDKNRQNHINFMKFSNKHLQKLGQRLLQDEKVLTEGGTREFP